MPKDIRDGLEDGQPFRDGLRNIGRVRLAGPTATQIN